MYEAKVLRGFLRCEYTWNGRCRYLLGRRMMWFPWFLRMMNPDMRVRWGRSGGRRLRKCVMNVWRQHSCFLLCKEGSHMASPLCNCELPRHHWTDTKVKREQANGWEVQGNTHSAICHLCNLLYNQSSHPHSFGFQLWVQPRTPTGLRIYCPSVTVSSNPCISITNETQFLRHNFPPRMICGP